MRKISNFIARASLCPKKSIINLMAGMVLLFMAFNLNANAQDSGKDKSTFKIGDRLPDLLFHKVLNYKDSTVRLSAFKGKVILLDFWATWCGSCINGFPHADALQKKYGKNLQVLMINPSGRDTPAKVEAFLTQQKKELPGFSIPLIIGDSTLKVLFPVQVIPHYIWLGADRRIKAITEQEEVTTANIERLVAGLSINLPLKQR
ncbi:TlpA family protein disulfide reductase [Pedobacter punctiformis]|uniref:TlpA disulfide reductase family protein n=1 Tax=Pedobacter punctiformis TaxID=3004097 RepID=A0ABT4L6J8_9SPHI|nr:TlpA disulfide reductase family protein [Pedobacter sp. HCMS5-2]MCZ4243538.1 TlpA disulfide reductase family protein [Pedobacter sp. HCMS5-2]